MGSTLYVSTVIIMESARPFATCGAKSCMMLSPVKVTAIAKSCLNEGTPPSPPLSSGRKDDAAAALRVTTALVAMAVSGSGIRVCVLLRECDPYAHRRQECAK